MHIDLTGKVIIVTGAAQGIGAAAATAAAAAGAELVLVDQNGPGLAASGLRGLHILGDLADPATPLRVIAEALSARGRIDGLVNAAGLTTRGGVLDGNVPDWNRLFSVNTRAPFFLMQGAITDMLARRAPGSIVNIQSMNAHCGTPELAMYAASKGALQTLTATIAHAHLADRIRVNGINLGWVATPGERQMQAQVLGKGDGWLDQAANALPLGRLVTADDCARLALFLLSDASAPMTGVSMNLEQRVLGAPP